MKFGDRLADGKSGINIVYILNFFKAWTVVSRFAQNDFLKCGLTQSSGLPMLRIVCPTHWPYPKPYIQTLRSGDCQCFALSAQPIGLTQSLTFKRSAAGTANASHCLPNPLALLKAFHSNAPRPNGFFNAHMLTRACSCRLFALKKPPTCVGGFVAGTGIEPVFAP